MNFVYKGNSMLKKATVLLFFCFILNSAIFAESEKYPDHIKKLYEAAKHKQCDHMEAMLSWKKKQGAKKRVLLNDTIEYAITQNDAQTTEMLTVRLADETNVIVRNPGYATAIFTAIIIGMLHTMDKVQ